MNAVLLITPVCFTQNVEGLQAKEAEECSGCDIEIVNIGPPPDDSSAPSDPETPDPLHSCGSPSLSLFLSGVPLQGNYCPQVFPVLLEKQDLQQMTPVTNKTHFCDTMEASCGAAKGEFHERSESGKSDAVLCDG